MQIFVYFGSNDNEIPLFTNVKCFISFEVKVKRAMTEKEASNIRYRRQFTTEFLVGLCARLGCYVG